MPDFTDIQHLTEAAEESWGPVGHRPAGGTGRNSNLGAAPITASVRCFLLMSHLSNGRPHPQFDPRSGYRFDSSGEWCIDRTGN